MDENPPNATVAVAEGVDGFELGVGEAGLDQRRHDGLSEVSDEIGQEPLDVLRWRGDVGGIKWVIRRTTHPVLTGSNTGLTLVSDKLPLESLNVGDRQSGYVDEVSHGGAHDVHVPRHQLRLVGEPAHRLVQRQLREGDLTDLRWNALQPRAGCRLGAQQQRGEVAEVSRPLHPTHFSDNGFRGGEQSGIVGGQWHTAVYEQVRLIRLERAPRAVAPRGSTHIPRPSVLLIATHGPSP